MKTGWKSLMVAGAVLVLGSSLVMAQSQKDGSGMGLGPKKPGRPDGLIPALAWWLDLTKEQVGQMHTIVEEARPDAKEAADAVADARNAFDEAVIAGAGAEEIRAAATVLGTAIGNQAVLRSQTLASLRAVLTEEQVKDFDKIRTKLPQLAQHLRDRKSQGERGVKSRKLPPEEKTGKTPAEKGDTGEKRPAEEGTMALVQIFKAADTNKDGVLTMEELKAYRGPVEGDQPASKK